MEHETAGDPMTGLKWTRRTTQKLSDHLRTIGICVSARTVARLLKSLGFSLRVNHKKICRVSPAERDQQFRYIKRQRRRFDAGRLPIISVDTKKKELIGNFKNPGRIWEESPTLVLDHDFRSDAVGLAVPYGILDLQANHGRVLLGLSRDTSAFAVNALVHWWRHEGRRVHQEADRLLILADSGGSNGARVRGPSARADSCPRRSSAWTCPARSARHPRESGSSHLPLLHRGGGPAARYVARLGSY
jgi:hypothetical protein